MTDRNRNRIELRVPVITAPSFSTTKSWAADLERGCTSIIDEKRPKTATTAEMVVRETDNY